MFRRCCVTALQAGRRCRSLVLQVSQGSGQGPGANQWAQVRSKHWGSTGYQSFQGQPTQLVTLRDPQAQRIIIFIAGSTVLIWWASREEVPYTHRKHSILVPQWVEQQMGEQTFHQITTMAAAEGKLLPALHPATLLVEKTGRKVAKAAQEPPEDGRGYVEHMKGLKWEFAVIDEVDPNAFVVPGGKVVVHTGLLKLLDDETQLANVLSHEAAHVVARHAAERMTQGATFEVLRMIAYWTIGIAPPAGLAVAVFFLPNSRRAETEADTIGLRPAAKCCYDPAAAAIVFKKLGQMEKQHGLDKMPGFLRTHPQTEARIKNVQAQLPAARQIFETRCLPGGDAAVLGREALQELMHPDTVTHDDDDGEFA